MNRDTLTSPQQSHYHPNDPPKTRRTSAKELERKRIFLNSRFAGAKIAVIMSSRSGRPALSQTLFVMLGVTEGMISLSSTVSLALQLMSLNELAPERTHQDTNQRYTHCSSNKKELPGALCQRRGKSREAPVESSVCQRENNLFSFETVEKARGGTPSMWYEGNIGGQRVQQLKGEWLYQNDSYPSRNTCRHFSISLGLVSNADIELISCAPPSYLGHCEDIEDIACPLVGFFG